MRDKKNMSAVFIALAVLIIDQLTKFIVLKNFLSGESLPVIENIFHISLVFNRGFAFGIFSKKAASTWIWIYCFAIAVIAFLFYQNAQRQRKDTQVFLALILGGAIGNLIDRMRFGHVVDFLDFRIWPVFNIADSAITAGTILLVLQILKSKKCIP